MAKTQSMRPSFETRPSAAPQDEGCTVLVLAPAPADQRSGGAFHRDFGFKVLLVAEDRSNGQGLAGAAIAQQAILLRDIALDGDVIPLLGVTDITDRNVVVLAPEEGDRVVGQPQAEHVERGGRALPFG